MKKIEEYSETVQTFDALDSVISNLRTEDIIDREELEKAVEEAWRAYDIAYIALMAYYKENT